LGLFVAKVVKKRRDRGGLGLLRVVYRGFISIKRYNGK